jgi:hypothetical protein
MVLDFFMELLIRPLLIHGPKRAGDFWSGCLAVKSKSLAVLK